MTATLLAFLLWVVAAIAAGLLLGAIITRADRTEIEPWVSGDDLWLADQPTEVLPRDEQVKRLERTWLL